MPASRQLELTLKRITDVFISLTAVVGTSPALLAIAVAIKLDSPDR